MGSEMPNDRGLNAPGAGQRQARSLMRIELAPRTEIKTEFSLEQCKRFWTKRYQKCRSLGWPEMHVASTAAIKNFCSASSQERHILIEKFRHQNEQFTKAVIRELLPYLKDIHVAVELGCGPCMFLNELAKHIDIAYGIELVSDLVEDMKIRLEDLGRSPKIFQGSAHEFFLSYHSQVGAVACIRAAIHWPEAEWSQTLALAQDRVKHGGIIAVCEMFQNDRPKRRKQHRGTWYRSIAQYRERLERMKLEHISTVLYYDDDPSRVLVFRKP